MDWELPLACRIGQHLMCGLPGYTLDDAFREAVRTYKISNVILFSRNIRDKEQLRTLCADIQELVQAACGVPALIGIDQEGGMVSRLSSDCTIVPSAMALGATGDERCALRAGILTGRELSALGVNVDFAPSLDMNSNPLNPVIGVRSYGDDPDVVSRFARSMVEGLQSQGVMAVGKHFPGHGDTHQDSHLVLPSVEGDLSDLQNHILPFSEAVRGGIQGIMSSHILFPDIEKEKIPATMSSFFMTELLKNTLGFKGLVFSDCMEMFAIAKHFGTVAGTVAAIKAGVDVVLISHTIDLGVAAAKAIGEALEDGSLSPELFDASTEKILLAKQMLLEAERKPFSVVGSAMHTQENQRLYDRSLTLVQDAPFVLGDKPLFVGVPCFQATEVSSEEHEVIFAPDMARLVGGTSLVVSENPDENEIHTALSKAKGCSSVVVGTYNGHQYPGQIALANALAKEHQVLTVALRNPYDLAQLDTSIRSIAVYAYNREVLKALARFLKGEISCTGVLPVQLVRT
ncbi:beta-N-acetylhexosaminidase [Sphaerochaeta halotolerans]|uniref:Beta-N-acetylhexosaminidase n=1 Tax=Sphaerochaeta halotolerans TaxID=2293840 RepID=A0A372MGS0_9SPIR|nr:beta-N-acetylhexosaminidase [Sphaerochaeta halotolerans]RFU94987.1 beta-N-acetylhexosaminidase [Sphaerochaeta halotolerans]